MKKMMMNWTIKKSLFISLFSVLSFSTFSQEYYPLHPSVGDTLDRLEKLDYSLFPKVSNKALDYCLITFEEGNYVLNSFYQNDSSVNTVLKQAEIVESQQNIEKVNAYYALKAKEDTIKPAASSLYPNKPSGKAPILLNGAMNEQAKKEARMIQRLRDDRRRMEDRQRGIRSNQLHLEFK